MSSIIPVICHQILTNNTHDKKVYASTPTEKVENEESMSLSYALVKPFIIIAKSLREEIKKHDKRK